MLCTAGALEEEEEGDLDALPEGKFHAPEVVVQQVPATPVIGGVCNSAAVCAFVGVRGGPIPAVGAVGAPTPERDLPDVGIDMEHARKRKENPLDNEEACPFEQLDDDNFFGSLGAEADPAVQQKLLDEAAAAAGKSSSSSASSSSAAIPDTKRTKGGPDMAEITLLMEQARQNAEDEAKGIILLKTPGTDDGVVPGAKLLG